MIYSAVEDNFLRVQLMYDLACQLKSQEEIIKSSRDPSAKGNLSFLEMDTFEIHRKLSAISEAIVTFTVITLESLVNQALAEKIPLINMACLAIEYPRSVIEKTKKQFANWNNTELGQAYDIYEEDGESVGQQFPSDTGPIDILAVKKDKSELLVVELKRGRASDKVVGQIQRYMGYCLDELAESNQTVRGIIIALEDDQKLKRALRVTQNIDFYRYKIDFRLIKG